MQGVLKDLYSGMSKFMEENREELDSPNMNIANDALDKCITCLLYTSDAADE